MVSDFQILFIQNGVYFRDNVEWDEEQEQLALQNVAKNSTVTLSEDEIRRFEAEAGQFWDKFYDIHQNRFFKDRHWLFTVSGYKCLP